MGRDSGASPSWLSPPPLRRAEVLGPLLAITLASCLSLLLLAGHTQVAILASLAIFSMALGVSAPHIARLTAFAALLATQFVIVVPFVRPTDNNYFAYTALLAMSLLVAVSVVQPPRPTLTGLFFGYLLTSAVLYVGVAQLRPNYQLFVFPLMAFCYFELALHSDRREIRLILAGLLAFAGIEAALGITQSLFGTPLFFFQEAMSSPRNPFAFLLPSVSSMARQGLGTYEHFNGLGGLLSLALPVTFGLAVAWRRTLLWAAFGLLAAGTFATFSRGAWLGSIVGVAAVLLATGSWRRRLGVAVTAGLFVILVMTLGSSILSSYYEDTQNLTGRVATWRVAATDISERPDRAVFGFGYSFYRETAADSAPRVFKAMSRVHSWLVEAVLELGVVGLGLLLICVLPPPLRALRSGRGGLEVALAGGILGFLTSQLFDNSLFGATGVFMFVLLGMLMSVQHMERTTPSL